MNNIYMPTHKSGPNPYLHPCTSQSTAYVEEHTKLSAYVNLLNHSKG